MNTISYGSEQSLTKYGRHQSLAMFASISRASAGVESSYPNISFSLNAPQAWDTALSDVTKRSYLDNDILRARNTSSSTITNGVHPNKKRANALSALKIEVSSQTGTDVYSDNIIITPPDPVRQKETTWDVLNRLVGSIEGPPDWSSELDHYLYGAPRRGKGNASE